MKGKRRGEGVVAVVRCVFESGSMKKKRPGGGERDDEPRGTLRAEPRNHPELPTLPTPTTRALAAERPVSSPEGLHGR